MGRNAIPKLGEWRDGSLYSFREVGTDKVSGRFNGNMIVYEKTTIVAKVPKTETLAVAYLDGLHEVLASFYHDGFRKGKHAGREEAFAEVRRLIGVKE